MLPSSGQTWPVRKLRAHTGRYNQQKAGDEKKNIHAGCLKEFRNMRKMKELILLAASRSLQRPRDCLTGLNTSSQRICCSEHLSPDARMNQMEGGSTSSQSGRAPKQSLRNFEMKRPARKMKPYSKRPWTGPATSSGQCLQTVRRTKLNSECNPGLK